MTAAAPLARYSAVEGALASGFAIADLHHAVGHDPEFWRKEFQNRYPVQDSSRLLATW
ncbi:hypothetical protein [Mesorhizobium sp.]|uniref:hypothetical protein n=1 Tax=Mesorhizobium sp. TaxID=1871066 RepID=UPI00257B8A6E|nr:hypothetical protein [Mesorhizobium sp.]